eukprot:5474545-Prymnesium_polylepis.1
MLYCLAALNARGRMTNTSCKEIIEAWEGRNLIECTDGSRSALGRAADCYVQPVYDARLKRQLVIFRRDFGTPGGWREIRGVQVVRVGLNEVTGQATDP